MPVKTPSLPVVVTPLLSGVRPVPAPLQIFDNICHLVGSLVLIMLHEDAAKLTTVCYRRRGRNAYRMESYTCPLLPDDTGYPDGPATPIYVS